LLSCVAVCPSRAASICPLVATKPPDWTVKLIPLLDTPPTVTITLPVVAPDGTVTVIELELQLVGVAAVPLKLTVLAPCVDPKFVPVIVTNAPTAPDVEDKLVMLGVGSTVNDTPALETPLTVTTTLPVVAPLGTGATMLVALQLVGVAEIPLNVSVLVPCVEAKFVPVIVTDVPTAPNVGDKLVMLGVGRTVKLTPLLAAPPTVTTTLPVVAAENTIATIELAFQLTIVVANVPLKETALVPCDEPKYDPLIETCDPTGPEVGDRDVIVAVVPGTIKLTSLLGTPLTVTTT